MARKVFISVLGTGYYNRTKYYWKDKSNYVETRFIQKATLELMANDGIKTDKAFFFLTRSSENTNWVSPAQTNNFLVKRGERDTYRGLNEVLNTLNIDTEFIPVNIPDGNNETEIWDIFDIVFNVLEENDEVYFDITHAFRSIPMLVMVLINYAKLLKNIKIKSITYGNWEGRDTENNLAPIIDLTAFSALQDWTNATNLFLTHGNMDALAQLTKSEVTPILKATKGKDKDASDLRDISGTMTAISTALKTNNAPDIIKATIFADFKKQLTGLNKDMIKPLSPVLDKINEKISHFSVSEDVMNGLKAVDFCIESGLIQQAYTMLQESIISLVLDSEKLNMKDDKLRNIASGAFKIKKENYPFEQWKSANANNRELTETFLCNALVRELASVFNALTDKRNIINHAGFNEKSSTKVFNNLEKDIKDLNQRVKEKLNI
jgi:CRISPR-associated Csx2 family protein